MADIGGSVGFSCPQCGASWIDGESQPEPQPVEPDPPDEATEVAVGEEESTLTKLTGSVLYGLSLPERTIRGAVGLTAGAVKELADAIVPSAFKDSTSYKIAIDNSLGFLTETIGGVPGKAEEKVSDDAAEAGEHLARKAVGNFVDMAGLAMLHVSPMWVLAVVSDVAYGTKSYTLELAKELEAAGLIDDTSTIHNVDDILDAVQRTTGTAASTFDKPPFSIEEMRQTITETRKNLTEADVRKLLPESEVTRYWQEMRTAASDENVSLLGLSGAVAMQTLDRVKGVSHSAVIGLKVAGNIVDRTIFTHYRESLTRIQEKGLITSVQESYGPYVEAVWSNFSASKKSWTESILDPGNIGKLFGKVTGLLGGGTSNESNSS